MTGSTHESMLEALCTVVRSAPGPIALAEVESGVILEISDAMLAMSGLTREQTVGSNSISVGWISDEDRASLVAELKEHGFTSPRRVSVADGTDPRVVGYATRLIHVGDRHYLLGTCEDLTEQDRMERSLHERDERLSLMTDAFPGFLWTVDADLTITSVSGGALASFHVSPEDLVGRAVREFVDDSSTELFAAYDSALSGDLRHATFSVAGHDWEATVQPMVEDGTVTGALAVGLDVTHRRESVEAQRRLADRLAALYDLAQATLAGRRPSEIAEAAVGRIRRLIGCHRCSVIEFDYVHDVARMLATSFEGESAVGPTAAQTLYLGSFSAITQGEEVGFPDLSKVDDLPELLQVLADEGIRTYLGFPVMVEGKVLAALTLSDLRVDAFDDEVKGVAREIAAHLAVGLEQASLHERTERDATELELRYAQLRDSDRERRRLLEQVVRTQEEERRHIASDIHDDSIQKMAAVGLRLDVLRHHLTDPEQLAEVGQLSEVVDMTIGRLRRLMFELWPPDLERYGLAAAIRADLIAQRDDFGIEYNLRDDMTATLPLEERIIAYRITQEALSNVRRHAGAGRVNVTLASKDGGVQASIIDDGKGMPTGLDTSPSGHLGLSSMRERAELAGGWLEIKATHPRGTRVEFFIPASGGNPG